MNPRIIHTRTIAVGCLDEGAGPLVVLCHGFPETKFAWRHQVKALAAAGYRAIAPDLRGYGQTDSPERVDQYTVFHCVGDLISLLDAVGHDKALVVGTDWGAAIAWQAALMRPDRFRAVVAMSVPMMGLSPLPPSSMFPQTQDALFYTLYFQEPGLADAELNQSPAATLKKILYAASGDAGPRRAGNGTPNPFGMVDRSQGLLASLPEPAGLPPWLSDADFEAIAADFRSSGFTGGLNYYRNLDRNWELQQATAGQKLSVPAQFMVGQRDTGLAIPGMEQIIADMPTLVPDLRGSHVVAGAGHWLQQERPKEVTSMLLDFLKQLP